MPSVVERFAPSPTGALHLGHAFSALTAWEAADRAAGRFLLRIDDLDHTRCRPQFVESIIQDVRWLGLMWHGEILHQSRRTSEHLRTIEALRAKGLVYPCTCSRQDIQNAAGAPQEGAETFPPYPGTCRDRPFTPDQEPRALRLNMRKAISLLGGGDAVRALSFEELGEGPGGETGKIPLDAGQLIDEIGDIVLRRKDGAIAYHLAVVLDDAFQGVSHVTRACDLFSSTPVHRLLQVLADLPTPIYRHHRIIRDKEGRRLAKRDGDMSLAVLREAGATPADIRALVGITRHA